MTVDLGSWLQTLGLERYAELFAAHEVDLAALRLLSEHDLQDLGLPLGPRRKLLRAIAELDGEETTAPGAQQAPAQVPTEPKIRPDAERRQLTVMFCDLVGSTELSQKLDPEALRELMRAYQQACGAVIEKYAGHVAQYLGDGLMVYFGWPRAHEDDAERAIRAGLEITETIKQVAAPEPLHVRIGIATGAVVVGSAGEPAQHPSAHLLLHRGAVLGCEREGLGELDLSVLALGEHTVDHAAVKVHMRHGGCPRDRR
jgi:Adenylate and Guanylate cyclase catalytic domain/SAM domain (Sterile alpha motif)